jgi:hypothetical protein
VEYEREASEVVADDIATTYAALTDEPGELGDDSDAPIHLDDSALTAASSGLDRHVRAENVNLSQGGVQCIEASSVSISQGGAGQVRAESMTVEQGGVGLARTGSLTLQSGASAFAVVADQATVDQGSNAFLVVSRSFSGDTKPTIDWRSAAAFGAGFALVLSIFRRRR